MKPGKSSKPVEPVKPVVLKMYRIEYTHGEFLTYWNGMSAAHARALCADYYHIAQKKLVAKEEK